MISLSEKIFPDDLINVILDNAFLKHGVEVQNVNLNKRNIDALSASTQELIKKVDEFLTKSKKMRLEAISEMTEVTVEEESEMKEAPEVKEISEVNQVRKNTFWGEL